MLLEEFLTRYNISLSKFRTIIDPITAKGFVTPHKSTISEWSNKGYTVQIDKGKGNIPEVLAVTPPYPSDVWQSERKRSVWQSKRYRGES